MKWPFSRSRDDETKTETELTTQKAEEALAVMRKHKADASGTLARVDALAKSMGEALAPPAHETN